MACVRESIRDTMCHVICGVREKICTRLRLGVSRTRCVTWFHAHDVSRGFTLTIRHLVPRSQLFPHILWT